MTSKEKLMRIVQGARGDDLERARHAFQGMTDKEMEKEYGDSGRTRSQILEGYRKEREEWMAVYELVKTVCL